MTWGDKFPHGNVGDKPRYIICADCKGDGWGPMLTELVWTGITTINEHHCRFFLCQPCMEKRLRRPLAFGDLRDCLMNLFHPKYRKDGSF